MTNLVICLMSVVTNLTPVKAYVYYDVNKPALWECDGKIQWNFHEETFYKLNVTTNFTYVSDAFGQALDRENYVRGRIDSFFYKGTVYGEPK